MSTQRALLALVAIVSLCGCTSRELYEAAQERQRHECRSGPPSDYDRCMERANESYDSYRRNKRQVEEGRENGVL